MKKVREALPIDRYKYTEEVRSKIDPDYYHTKTFYKCPRCKGRIDNFEMYDEIKCVKCNLLIEHLGDFFSCTIKER